MSQLDEAKPYWFVVAESLLGSHEKQGINEENPIVSDIYAIFSAKTDQDEKTWGAAFVGACLHLSGFQSSHALTASSYQSFGKQLSQPVKGCIVLLKPAVSLQASSGHVAFFSHVGEDDKIYCLGGHHPESVSLAGFNRAYVRGYSWPVKIGSLPEPRPRHLFTIDNLTHDVPPHLLDIFPDNSPRVNKESIWQGETGGLKDIIPLIGNNIYKEESYIHNSWNVNACDSLPKPLALLVTHSASLVGFHKAAEFLQQTLNKQGSRLLIDGDIGVKSIAASQRVIMEKAVHDFCELQRAHLKANNPASLTSDLLAKFGGIEAAALGFIPQIPKVEVITPVENSPEPMIEPLEEAMPNQISLSSEELTLIIENAVKEAVRKSTPAIIEPVKVVPAPVVIVPPVEPVIIQPVIEAPKVIAAIIQPHAPSILTAIDRVLGGRILAGKKTMIAIAAGVINIILEKKGIIAGDTADIINVLVMGLGAVGILSKIDRVIEARAIKGK
jgi:uncharacterized protein (TIGR02594 family)